MQNNNYYFERENQIGQKLPHCSQNNAVGWNRALD